jgi:hypothetical protein
MQQPNKSAGEATADELGLVINNIDLNNVHRFEIDYAKEAVRRLRRIQDMLENRYFIVPPRP